MLLLFICTSTYAHAIMPGFIDRNKDGYVSLTVLHYVDPPSDIANFIF